MPEIPDSRGGPFDEAETRSEDMTRKKSLGERVCESIPELHANFLARLDKFVEFLYEHTKDPHEDLAGKLRALLSRPEEGTPFFDYIHRLAPQIFSFDPTKNIFSLEQQTHLDAKLHNVFITRWFVNLSMGEITVVDLVQEALILKAQVKQKEGFIEYLNFS